MPQKDKIEHSPHLDIRLNKVSPTCEGLRGTNKLIKVENLEREIANAICCKTSLIDKGRLKDAVRIVRSDNGSQKLRSLTHKWESVSANQFVYWSMPFLYDFEESSELLSNYHSRRFSAVKNIFERIRNNEQLESTVKSFIFLFALYKGNRASKIVACHYFYTLSPESRLIAGDRHNLPIPPYSDIAVDLLKDIIQQDDYDNVVKLDAITTLKSLYRYANNK